MGTSRPIVSRSAHGCIVARLKPPSAV
ncbi:hypothetical protein FBR02_05820 [Anaerolineae bacterium CFX9]|nr:hypothetical protein [Anaerolineae bacterium CFX9]